jgi:hypothetical protein
MRILPVELIPENLPDPSGKLEASKSKHLKKVIINGQLNADIKNYRL